MKKALFTAIALMLIHNITFAKTLTCQESFSFTKKSISINRDGAIGFNGTYIYMQSPLGIWDAQHAHRLSLDSITGDLNDKNLVVTGLVLAINPKESCTNPDAEPGVAFECSASETTIIAISEGSLARDSGIWDQITMQSQLKAQVHAKLTVNENQRIILSGSITARMQSIPFQLSMQANNDCEITDI